ncbi:putative TetR family transcriptional regulator [Gordonia effusa NBRC 100432]|uniref:Putative TetR family transcriptional regulator n=1 Tax=Gordonia effusa NBRC 100432 TaxID=1077974 RepID=H0R577_9ACTN|nr:TetR/AcrR family transcriptional regulator [Gordonia effusa]GAB20228.1 putative TetR family transcriptional regulator [Gordonia effusa NBRC 100432]
MTDSADLSGINPIAARSQEWLINALFALMREKSYSDITITDIATRAELSRRTFYRNFATKDELIDAYCRRLVDDYVHRMRKADLTKSRDVALRFFEFWTDHADFLELLTSSGLSSLLLRKFNEHIGAIFIRTQTPRFDDAVHLEYALAFTAGGYFNVLFAWLHLGKRETPAEMADAIVSLPGN